MEKGKQTRDDIIQGIIDEQIIEKCSTVFANYISPELKYDYIQDMYLAILEIPDDKLLQLYNDGTLNFYILSICKYQATMNNSKFHTRYTNKLKTVQLNDEIIKGI